MKKEEKAIALLVGVFIIAGAVGIYIIGAALGMKMPGNGHQSRLLYFEKEVAKAEAIFKRADESAWLVKVMAAKSKAVNLAGHISADYFLSEQEKEEYLQRIYAWPQAVSAEAFAEQEEYVKMMGYDEARIDLADLRADAWAEFKKTQGFFNIE